MLQVAKRSLSITNFRREILLTSIFASNLFKDLPSLTQIHHTLILNSYSYLAIRCTASGCNHYFNVASPTTQKSRLCSVILLAKQAAVTICK